MVAEGEMPDKFRNIGGYGTFDAIEQGLIREIDPDWYYEYMPTRMRYLEEKFGLSKDEVIERHKYEGKWYGVSGYYTSQTGGYIRTIRQDYADNVGYKGTPKTMEDFFELAKLLTFNDPDRNGKDDTWAIGGPAKWGAFGFADVLGSYGLQPATWWIEDGKVVYSETHPAYKGVLDTMAKWYAAGVIDPEFMTDGIEDWLNKWKIGLHGSIFVGMHGFMDAYGDYKQPVIENNPGATFTHLDALIGPTGKAAYGGDPSARLGYGTVGSDPLFGYKASDEEVKKIMEMFDTVLADEDLYVACCFGEEGTMWTWEGSTRVHKPGYGYQETEGQQEGLMCFFNVAYAPFEWWKKGLTDFDVGLLAYWDRQPKVCRGVYCLDIGDTSPATAKYSEIVGDRRTTQAEFFFKVVTGQTTVEEGWDDHLKKMKAIGLNDYNAEIQAIYDEWMKSR
jgi:putative aldouronate transport system substrate-binding protein